MKLHFLHLKKITKGKQITEQSVKLHFFQSDRILKNT